VNPDDVDGDGLGECVWVGGDELDELDADVDECGTEDEEPGVDERGVEAADVPGSAGGRAGP